MRASAFARKTSRWRVAAWIAVCLLATGRARADSTSTPSATPVFRYTEPQPPDYVRSTLEELGLLGIGFTQYLQNHDLNSQDWDFSYTWGGLRSKLGGHGYSLDTNGFNTNFVSHPIAGTLYYWAARANRMSVLASFANAFVASAIWEYFAELRERASVNDLLVTPIAGFVLGETTLQLGMFFERGCASIHNGVLGWMFDPVKSLHDVLDGAHPLRSNTCDRYGFTRLGDHEIRLSLEGGAMRTVRGLRRPWRAQTGVLLHTRVVALDDYGSTGEGFTTFADGNVTELWLGGAWTDSSWNDFVVRATVIPMGLHYRSLALGPSGLSGHDIVFGLLVGAEYNAHRYEIGSHDIPQNDRIFVLDAPGVSLAYRRLLGATRVEIEFQSSTALAGIEPFALPIYLRDHPLDTLSSITRVNGYEYAVGFRMNPRARVMNDWFEAGAELASMRVWVINELDRNPTQRSHVSGAEQRHSARVWASAGPRHWPLRFTLSGALLERSGSTAAAQALRTELRLQGGLDAVL